MGARVLPAEVPVGFCTDPVWAGLPTAETGARPGGGGEADGGDTDEDRAVSCPHWKAPKSICARRNMTALCLSCISMPLLKKHLSAKSYFANDVEATRTGVLPADQQGFTTSQTVECFNTAHFHAYPALSSTTVQTTAHRSSQYVKADKSTVAREWTALAFDAMRAEPDRKKEPEGQLMVVCAVA